MCNCWYCGHKMIWQSDFSYDEVYDEGEGIIAYLKCSNEECNAIAKFIKREDL